MIAIETVKAREKTYRIGQVVKNLKERYPDLSISKVRFLEDEGLLNPKRTKGGYRLFGIQDIERLDEVLRLQEEYFLPLVIIKERLKGWSKGKETLSPKGAVVSKPQEQDPFKESKVDEIVKKTGLSVEALKELENFDLIEITKNADGNKLKSRDVEIVFLFAKLSKFGIEARHLRMYENLAHRESLLFQQILAPQILHKSQKLRDKGLKDLQELIDISEELKSAILRKLLRQANFRV